MVIQDWSWDDVRIFLAVAEEGSFSAAALKLELGQPTISRRVAMLEESLGYPLFRRGRRGTAITKGGERLLELDVTAATLKIDAAQIKLEQLKQAKARGPEIAQAEIAIKQAEVDLQRAQTLLELHRRSRPVPSLPPKASRAR